MLRAYRCAVSPRRATHYTFLSHDDATIMRRCSKSELKAKIGLHSRDSVLGMDEISSPPIYRSPYYLTQAIFLSFVDGVSS